MDRRICLSLTAILLTFASCKLCNNNLRSHISFEVNVMNFGAVGDGMADDSAAFQKAFDHISKTGARALFIPPGSYRLNQQVTLNLNTDGLTVRGLGMGVSNILCDNPEGAVSISGNDLRGAVTIENLSFFAMRQNAGTALEITNKLSGGPGHFRNLIVQNIEMRGHGKNSSFYFNRGLNAYKLWRPLFINVLFDGVYYPGMASLENFHADDSLLYRPTCGIQADYCYAPSFQHCYVWCAQTGYRIVSTEGHNGPEDGAFYRSFAVQCRIGIDIDTPISEPQLVIEACHINCRDVGIRLNNRKFFQITRNLLYSEAVDDGYPYVDIQITGASFGGVISQNIFQDPSKTNYMTSPAASDINHVNIKLGQDCRDMTITENIFNAKCRTIQIDGNQDKFVIKDNVFSNPKAIKPGIETVAQ